MFKLYYMPGACSLVPHIALEWAQANYELVRVQREKLHEADYLHLNPQGKVPLLQEGEWVLSQNTAILEYLNARFPTAHLFGNGNTKAQARARQWLAYANADVHPTFSALFAPTRLVDGEDAQAKVHEKGVQRLQTVLEPANETLSQQNYLAGELTIADVYLYVTLRWAKALNIDLNNLSALAPFFERVEANKGVQAALKQQGLL